MENVVYLEVEDFNDDGSIKPCVNNGKPVVLMVQATTCFYCKQAAPAFEEFANESKNIIVVATIVSDGDNSEKQAAEKYIKKWDPDHRGVPAYFGFSSNGKFFKQHTGNRDVFSLMRFATTL